MAISMTISSAVTDRTKALWRTRLGSALRTVLACTIVGCATLYGPSPIRSEIPFPAFSYVTAILIVSEPTLGHTIMGSWHAFLATVQVVPLSILLLWIIGPCRLNPAFACMAVVAGSFLLALPKSTKLLTKRIGFGQLVIVCVGSVLHGDRAGNFYIHPLHIASSTTLGALASVLAMLLPYPRLAIKEVSKLFQLYNENATERATLLLKAFLAQDKATAIDLISQSTPFAETGAKLLHSIKQIQDGVQWEKPRIKKSTHQFTKPGNRLQEMETVMRGLEIALASCNSFPLHIIDEKVRSLMLQLEVQLRVKIGRSRCFMPSETMTAPETIELVNSYESLHHLSNISLTQNDLPSFFFFSCLQQLLTVTDPAIPKQQLLTDSVIPNNHSCQVQERDTGSKFSPRRILEILKMTPNNENIVFAFKCSITLGLAVLFGLIFNIENAYWSGLTIAISIVSGRQATITYSNARAQGTAIGTVYGIVGYFIFRGILEMRFMLLLPWIVFTGFLRHSKMYGQAGYISAVIAALLILGRKNYGQPHEFAIIRLTEAVSGLFCLVIVELIIQPTRACTLAKGQLSMSLGALGKCIEQIVLFSKQKENPDLAPLIENERKLKTHVNELKRFTDDAAMEPDFWFLPFNVCSYNKLHVSLSNMVHLLHFTAYIMKRLQQESNGLDGTDIIERMNEDLEIFKETICSSLKFLEKITSIKHLAVFLQEEKVIRDLESGKSSDTEIATSDEACEKILNSFSRHLNEVRNRIGANEGEEVKVQMILNLGSLGFCISGLMREAKEIEKGVKELIRRENPSTRIDFFENSSKIHSVDIVNRTPTVASSMEVYNDM